MNQPLLIFLDRFLGDQRPAYNQELEFKLRVNEAGVASINDVILEGNGLQIYQSIFNQGNQLPSTSVRFHILYF